MYYNGYENPKLAAIRLLRSQGCCEKKQQQRKPNSPNVQSLLRYKEELEHKVVRQKAKLADVPCVLQLGQQIEELQQVIDGLARQNKQRIKLIKRSTKQTHCTGWQDEQSEKQEHRRLQDEYNLLLGRVKKINQRNDILVKQLK